MTIKFIITDCSRLACTSFGNCILKRTRQQRVSSYKSKQTRTKKSMGHMEKICWRHEINILALQISSKLHRSMEKPKNKILQLELGTRH